MELGHGFDEVEFEDSEGNRLHGRLYGDAATATASFTFCHGFLGTQDYVAPEFIGRILGHLPGWAALSFDYSGFGVSPGRSHRVDPFLQSRNAQAAVDFLASACPQAPPRSVSLLGISFGSGVALAAGGNHPEVDAVVVLSAYRTGEEWLRDMRPLHEHTDLVRRVRDDAAARAGGNPGMFPLAEVFRRDPDGAAFERELRKSQPDRLYEVDSVSVERILAFRPIDATPGLRTKRVLFAHCERDVTMWPEHARWFASEAAARFDLLAGVDHYEVYQPPHLDGLCATIAEFFGPQSFTGAGSARDGRGC